MLFSDSQFSLPFSLNKNSRDRKMQSKYIIWKMSWSAYLSEANSYTGSTTTEVSKEKAFDTPLERVILL